MTAAEEPWIEGVEVAARDLSARGPRGPVWEGVSLRVPAGGLSVAHGPSGSGRTSLLLALAGRLRVAAGTVQVGGHAVPRAAGRVRRLVAVARAAPAVFLEPRLRVRELAAERRWLAPGADRAAVRRAMDVVGFDAPDDTLVADLDPVASLALALALALAESPRALVVDDVDSGCPPDQRAAAWQAVRQANAAGCTVLSAALAPPDGPEPPYTALALPRLSADALTGTGAAGAGRRTAADGRSGGATDTDGPDDRAGDPDPAPTTRKAAP
ncbi:ATP-binding cassette domain-containing protein [Streptomyces sp. NBC_01477]|uniref:ATP-binding cassette domain-containing protein n=1 Tax=Streptomyces sp. NBC_01477 TaxID=2976015 RepID=UPI002E2EC188|nr:ATP-binding cassette domain-containing protein [Streptomyces sp. NBC_01477]